jgi:hypothetical protein
MKLAAGRGLHCVIFKKVEIFGLSGSEYCDVRKIRSTEKITQGGSVRIKKHEMAWDVKTGGGFYNGLEVSVSYPILERTRHSRKDNTKLDLKEIWCERVD